MTPEGDGRGPSLVDQVRGVLGGWSGRVAWPSDFGPSLLVLAAIPGALALLAGGLVVLETHRNGALARVAAPQIAASAARRRTIADRAAIAPLLGVPTLTSTLAGVVALLPRDASLHAIARDGDGTTRIEVDCTDPDALLRAFRGSPGRWRSVAQSVTAGTGVRVTLEMRAR